MIIIDYIISSDATKINTVFTIISIVCTIVTGIWAKRTNRIKKELQQKLNSYELVSYKDQFHSLYLELSTTIRQSDWNQGGKSNELLSNLEKKLRDFNKFNKKLFEEKQETIKLSINSALKNLDSVFKGYYSFMQNLLSDLDNIDDNLNTICNDLMSK